MGHVRIPLRPSPSRAGARTVRPRRITVTIDVLDGGRLRVATPQARGWAVVVRGPLQTWGALRQALVEAQIAGHARWRGARYDLDALTARDDPTEPAQRALPRPQPRHGVSYARSAVVRPDQAHPSEWAPMPDGTWMSPKGRIWRDPTRIASLVEKRAALGLPITYDDWARRPAS